MSQRKKVEENISKILDVEYSVTSESPSTEETEIVKSESNKDSDKDYNLVRKNLKNLIKQSEAAIEGILDVASESESPRAYEVVSQLIH